jgi:hypothetical protein
MRVSAFVGRRCDFHLFYSCQVLCKLLRAVLLETVLGRARLGVSSPVSLVGFERPFDRISFCAALLG